MAGGLESTEEVYPYRFGIAAGVGLTWAALWVGLAALHVAPWVFWSSSLIVFGPVVAAVTRQGSELLLLLLTAYLASWAVSLLLVGLLLGRSDWSWPFLTQHLSLLTLNWLPTGAGAGLLWGFFFRRRTGTKRRVTL